MQHFYLSLTGDFGRDTCLFKQLQYKSPYAGKLYSLHQTAAFNSIHLGNPGATYCAVSWATFVYQTSLGLTQELGEAGNPASASLHDEGTWIRLAKSAIYLPGGYVHLLLSAKE